MLSWVRQTTLFSLVCIALLMSLVLPGCEDADEPFKEVQQDSFWQTASPASQGMDGDGLEELSSRVAGSERVLAFLIAKNGKIVHEQYLNGANQFTLLHIRSVTKRITATLMGIALDEGIIADQHASISTFFPELENATGEGWEEVSIYHLLNMVSGMEWSENDLNEYQNNFGDPLSYIFSRDITHEPSTYHAYNTPGIDLLSFIIERTSGDDVADFAQENLFGPLGILGYEWQEIGDGVEWGGAGLELTARDLAKLGLLYLQNGEWNGQQVVSEDWIDQCFTDVIALDELDGPHLPGLSIGQTWWTREIEGHRVHYGDGYGGQVLLVVPEYEIVIVMNHVYEVSPDQNNAAFQFLFGEVLPDVLASVVN